MKDIMNFRILVGVPIGGMLNIETATTLLKLTKKENVDVCFSKSCVIHENRNELVEIAKKDHFDYLLFLDSDSVFINDVLDLLLEANKDIIGCDINKRQMPLEGTCRDIHAGLIDTRNLIFPFKCGYVGTGCLLIKMTVFDKLEKPYFNFIYTDGVITKGEDHYFCDKARQAGFDIWCEPKAKVGHVGDYIY